MMHPFRMDKKKKFYDHIYTLLAPNVCCVHIHFIMFKITLSFLRIHMHVSLIS